MITLQRSVSGLEMRGCEKDTDPVDPGQLEVIEQLNDPLPERMTARRTAGLREEWEEDGEEGRQCKKKPEGNIERGKVVGT